MRTTLKFIIVTIILFYSSVSFGAYTIKEGHPRLFIDSSNLATIQARCATGIQGTYYGRLKTYIDARIDNSYTPSSSDSGNGPLIGLAFLALMGEIDGYSYTVTYGGETGIDAYAARGIDLLEQYMEHYDEDTAGHYAPTFVVTVAYDWLHSFMTSGEREGIVNNMIEHQVVASAYAVSSNLWAQCMNSGNLYHKAYSVMAAAYYGDGIEDETAEDYLDEFETQWVGSIFPIWNRLTKGGGHPFGFDYGGIWPKYISVPLELWNAATSGSMRSTYDGFPNYELLFKLYNLIPYVTYLHCTTGESPCWGSTGWQVYRLETRGLLRETGSCLVKYGDFPLPLFQSVSYPEHVYNYPDGIASIGIMTDKGYTDYAEASQWNLLFHGSEDTPSDIDTLSDGPYYDSTSNPMELVFDITLRDTSIEATAPMDLNLPKAHMFGTIGTGPSIGSDFGSGAPEGVGIITTRSDWEDVDATLFWYKATPYVTIHHHRDMGTFQIYKGGWLATDSGQYTEADSGTTQHDAYYQRTTASANSILVYDPDEIWNGDSYHNSFLLAGNSGGQRDPGANATVAGMDDIESDPDEFFGGITAYEHHDDKYTYTSTDMTRAYQSSTYNDDENDAKLSKATRQWAYFPDKYVVIYDRVTSTDGSFPKRWLLHSVYRPTLDGDETFSGTIQYSTNIPGKSGGVALTGNASAGISESYNTDSWYVNGYNFEDEANTTADGRLFVQTLLPENNIHRVVGGSGYEFMNAEYDNFPIDNEAEDPSWREQMIEHGSWRMEVEPTGDDYPQTDTRFLHVLDVETQSIGTITTNSLIESSAGTDMQGAYISGSDRNKVIMFSKSGSAVSTSTFDIVSSPLETDILITDLTPETTYYYTVSGTTISFSTSDNGGTIRESSDQGTLYLGSFTYCDHDDDEHDCVVDFPVFDDEPAKGEVYLGKFNAEIVRMTDATTEADNYTGSQDGFTLRYASINQENCDGTYVVVEDHVNSKSWNLYNAQTLVRVERLTDMPDGVGDGGPRWDATDPDVFYYTKYMVMYKYDLSEDLGSRITTVRDFSSDWPTGYQIDWVDEGEPDGSTRYWAVHCRATGPGYEDVSIACYDKQTNTILGQITSFPYDSDWVAMSPSGEYLLVRWAYADGRIWAYNRAMTEHTEVCLGAGHADRAVDADGNDVVVYHSNTGTYQDGWYHMSYMDGTDVPLIDFENQHGNTDGEHFSGNNYDRPGWAFVSTFTNDDDPDSYDEWLDGRIFAIELKVNPRVWSIVHHKSIWGDAYRNAPMAQINGNGTRLYFGSNWGTGDRTLMEVYQIILPENWDDILEEDMPTGNGSSVSIGSSGTTLNVNASGTAWSVVE